MKFTSILPSPSASVGTAIGVMALVYTIYNSNLPPTAVTQATDAYDNNLESARRKAAMMAVTAVCGISLLTKDVTILTLGGATVIGLDFAARHSIVTHPATGQIVTQTMRVPTLSAVSE